MLDCLKRNAIDNRVDVVPLKHDNKFWAIAKALEANNPSKVSGLPGYKRFTRPLIALDPGETTGIAIWDPTHEVILLAQINTKVIGLGYDSLWAIITRANAVEPSLEHVRYEDYRVYGHMTEQHSFSHLHTARMIGAIEVICHLVDVPWSNCLAMHAKTFWTDEKLKMCGLYNRGMKHSRDAERHLLRYMGE